MSLQLFAFSKTLLPPKQKTTAYKINRPLQVSTFAVAAIVPVRFMPGFSSDEVLNLRVWALVRPSFSSCNTVPLAYIKFLNKAHQIIYIVVLTSTVAPTVV